MKIIYLFLLILLSFNLAYSFETVSIPNENLSNAQSFNQTCPIADEEISDLEKIIFNKIYSNDNPQKRISRLEKEVFGMEQKGDYEYRFDNLLTASDYYKSGYRQGENLAQTQQNKYAFSDYKLNSKNYIQNYNFDDNFDKEPEQKYFAQKQPQYYFDEDYDAEQKPKKKQSKIKQFFSDLADALSSGVVTGFTPSINSYNLDPFDNFTPFGSSSFMGFPQGAAGVYVPGRTYNRYYPRHNYYAPPPPPSPQRHRSNYRNYYSPARYNSGAGVRIIH